MPDKLTVGLIGLDTSHVVAFTKALNDPSDPDHVPGAKVTTAFPGGSKDFDLSWSRVEGFTKELREKYQVKMVDSPQAVAQAVDLLFIESVDGRVHRALVEQTIKFKRPTFVDKPLAVSSADAAAIFAMAKSAGVTLMSASSLRYADALCEAVGPERDKTRGAIVGCEIFGPMYEQPVMPGLFWYGIHTVEMLYAVMGRGCATVRTVANADGDVVTATWRDGRMAVVRGLRRGHSRFGAVIHRMRGFDVVDSYATPRSCNTGLLEVVIQSLTTGKPAVPPEESLEVIAFIEAANRSRPNGAVVELAAPAVAASTRRQPVAQEK